MPNPGQEIKLRFKVKIEGGRFFDGSDDRGEPLTMNIGAGQQIDGIEKAVITMRLNEIADILISPKYGYGAMGSPPHIPGNATLNYRVEIVQIGQRRRTAWGMTDDELIKMAQSLKDDGNAKFKENNLKEAENLYRDGILQMKDVKKDDEASKKVRIVLHQNLCLVLNKQGNYKETIEFSTRIIEREPTADKALYHRYTANLKLKQYDDAMQDLKAVIKIHPQDKNYRAEFEKLKQIK